MYIRSLWMNSCHYLLMLSAIRGKNEPAEKLRAGASTGIHDQAVPVLLQASEAQMSPEVVRPG